MSMHSIDANRALRASLPLTGTVGVVAVVVVVRANALGLWPEGAS